MSVSEYQQQVVSVDSVEPLSLHSMSGFPKAVNHQVVAENSAAAKVDVSHVFLRRLRASQ